MGKAFKIFHEYFSWAGNNLDEANNGECPSNLKTHLIGKIGHIITPQLVFDWAVECGECSEDELINVRYIYQVFQIRKKHEHEI